MIRCSQARRRILASRDARLSLAERLELDEHLQGCEACRALDLADASLDEALAALPEPPIERIDLDAAVRAVRARIDGAELERSAQHARRARLRRWVGWSVAAAAVAALAGWLILGRGGSSTASRNELVESVPPPATSPVVPGSDVELDGAPEQPSSVAQADIESDPPRATRPDANPSEIAQLSESPAVDAEPEEPPIDVERHDRARAAVREAFALAVAARAGSAEESDVLAARLQTVEAPLKDIAADGWNVSVLAERVLADADAEVAGLAARWLAQKGDRLSINKIGAVLTRPNAPAALRRQATLALLDDGEPGIAALGPALADAELRALTLERLIARGSPASVEVMAKALAETRQDGAAAADLAHALARLGEPGVDALLESVRHGGLVAESALSELRRTRGAPERLAVLLGERASARVIDARIEAAARLGLAEVLPLLRERALDRGHRNEALAQLSAFPSRGALAIVLELWSSSRFGEDELGATARSILERDPLEGLALVGELEQPMQEPTLHDLVDLLLATDSRSAAPSLARLVGSPWLPSDERQWAAVALAELGSAEEAQRLAETLRELQPEDQRLAAACALAIHALGGASALRETFGPADAPVAERLIALLERRPSDRNPAATISRAARLLEPWLESRTLARRTTP
jgi:Putative zinc-finger